MPYAVELLFDTVSSGKIEEIWQKLQCVGASEPDRDTLKSGAKPHVSLAVFNDIDIEDAGRKLRTLASQTDSFTISLSSVGIFTGSENVLYLGPVANGSLIRLHDRVHTALIEYNEDAWKYCPTGNWVPHCTLAINSSR